MSDKLKRVWSFVDGAKGALDIMDSPHGGKHERSEYWRGYRHALDHFGEYLDVLEAEEIEASIRPAP